MNQKHTPASPLPWWLFDFHGGKIPKDARGIFLPRGAMPGTMQNLEYWIHAANAYPKLIEVATLATDGFDHSAGMKAEALLKELGER